MNKKIYLVFLASSICVSATENNNAEGPKAIIIDNQYHTPLTIHNMFTQYQQADTSHEKRRLEECTNYIKSHADEALKPGWRYFCKNWNPVTGLKDDQRSIEEKIQECIPGKLLEDERFKDLLKHELTRIYDQRRFRCLEIFSCGSTLSITACLWMLIIAVKPDEVV